MGFFKNAINTVASGIGNIFGSTLAYKGQKDTNKTNIALAEQARTHDVDMWNRQNAYNTPEMQMQRLKEAGLNPNLIYGSGQASTGNADAPKGAPVPHVSNALATFANNNATQLLSQYQDWQVKKAQIKNIEADTKATEFANILRQPYTKYATELMRYDKDSKKYKFYQDVNRHQILNDQMNISRETLFDRINQEKLKTKYASGQLKYQGEAINYLRKQAKQKDLQIQLDEQLKPYGMSTADELWQRKLVPIIEDLLSPQKWIRNKFKK